MLGYGLLTGVIPYLPRVGQCAHEALGNPVITGFRLPGGLYVPTKPWTAAVGSLPPDWHEMWGPVAGAVFAHCSPRPVLSNEISE